MKPKPAAFLDIKGYKQVLENSGLVPKYIKKKVFLFFNYFSDAFSSFFFYGASRMDDFCLCRIMEKFQNTSSSAERSSRELRRTLRTLLKITESRET